jgi:hypothetical protein
MSGGDRDATHREKHSKREIRGWFVLYQLELTTSETNRKS